MTTVILNATVSWTMTKSVSFNETLITPKPGFETVTLSVLFVSLVSLDLATAVLFKVPLTLTVNQTVNDAFPPLTRSP